MKNSRSLLFLAVLVSGLVGYVLGGHQTAPGDDRLGSPAAEPFPEEVARLRQQVLDFQVEREALRSQLAMLARTVPKPPEEAMKAMEGSLGSDAFGRWSGRGGANLTDVNQRSHAALGSRWVLAAQKQVLEVQPVKWTANPVNVNRASETIRFYLTSVSGTFNLENGVQFGRTQNAAADMHKKLQDVAKSANAQALIGQFRKAIAQFKKEQNRYPYTLDELTVVFPGRDKGYMKTDRIPADPWGSLYLFELAGGQTGYEIRSAGPDAVYETADDIRVRGK